ncbi:MAG: hypothetical protein WAQ28_13710 [Bacteroidia bacterium]
MAIILKDEIRSLADDTAIKLLGDSFLSDNIESCSYDLRIGTIFKSGKIYSNEFNPEENWNIEIKPSEIVTILTLEEVNLPRHIAGTVFALNSLSSAGFLILNPGHIDPGFKGPISICAVNLSKSTIKLHYGKKIFTVIFERLDKEAEPYNNKIYKNRKETEQVFFREKASGLSNSFFDLIKENEYTPYLKELINQIIRQKIYTALKWLIGAIVTIAAILKGIDIFFPFGGGDTINDTKLYNDSLKTEINILKKDFKLKDDSVQFLLEKQRIQNSDTSSTLLGKNGKK